MASARTGEERIHINASPDAVYDVICDPARMGEWSPECYRVDWLDGASAPARPGARFKGRNRYGPIRWSMTCEVKSAEPGREISWSTVEGDREQVRWTYRLEPMTGGTDLVESFDVHWLPFRAVLFEDYLMIDRDRGRAQAMATTLQRIKAAAEATR
jgi:uncharacterized protein YndB with AHSA1/START domain